jgi:DNA-binding response OmpR family regulator
MHIALVEDELKLATTLAEGLSSEGYLVDIYGSGEEAESHCLGKDPDHYALMILDLSLPEKDGFTVCQSLRDAGYGLPILILTARDSTEDTVRALTLGADDYLTKPFSYEELLARVHALIRRAEHNKPKILRLNDLAISLSTRLITRNGLEVHVTPTEFAILALLIEHEGEVVTREEIAEHLLDGTDPMETNIIDVHVSNLRKKLDASHDQKIIRTVRGAGYTIQK